MTFLFMIALGCVLTLGIIGSEYRKGTKLYSELRSQITIKSPESPEREKQVQEQISEEGDGRAWIYCPDTPIDYPVMQAPDNAYYLTRMANGESNANGSIFLDYKNSPDFTDASSILYGHHMNNGMMFAALSKYKDKIYYEQHPMFYLYTKKETYRIELFAGYTLDGSESLPTQFAPGGQQEYVSKAKKQSFFQSDIQPLETDRLLLMVTCDYAWDNARYVLAGRMVRVELNTQ